MRWTASLGILVLCVLAAGARTLNETAPETTPTTPLSPPRASLLEAALTASTLSVTADVSSETHADALELALDRQFPDHDAEFYWRVGDADADWQLLTLAAVDVLAETTVSRMRLDPGGLNLEGLRPSGRLFDVRLARVVAVAGDSFSSNTAVYEGAVGGRSTNACSTMFRSIRGEPVRFFSGTADLRPSSFALLDRYAEFASDCPSARLAVYGHTDAAGDDAYNQYLSEQRAGEVADYLVRAGIAPDRVLRSGKGESEPVADNGTAWGRSRNRRIEISLLPP